MLVCKHKSYHDLISLLSFMKLQKNKETSLFVGQSICFNQTINTIILLPSNIMNFPQSNGICSYF